MHNLIKLSAVMAIMPILFGCSGTPRLTYLDKSYKTETISVDLKIPQFNCLKDNEFQDSVNNDIQDACTEFLNKFKDSAKELSVPSVFTAETQNYSKGNIVSLVTQIEYYTKKPHNNSFRIAKNINTSTSSEFALRDMFQDSSYIDFINSALIKTVEAQPENYSDLWAKPVLAENQSFYITEDSLVLYYPPYELSYYTRGFVEFSIPLSELGGYMTEDYRRELIKKS